MALLVGMAVVPIEETTVLDNGLIQVNVESVSTPAVPTITIHSETVYPTPTPEPTPNPYKATLGYVPTKQELDLLERLVFCEAGNQSLECKVAVVNVIINRVKSSTYPNTLMEVMKQKYQFSPVLTGWVNTVTATDECKEAVRLALNGKKVVKDSTLYFFATWLKADSEMWKITNVTKTIGKVHFGEAKR